mmetsp:Transcript_14983/g.30898  ORF Transcript_14983/g.30898 Transcript_14983/m.30898 type:complete len:108 (+) Transcript_14983:449-772(+)
MRIIQDISRPSAKKPNEWDIASLTMETMIKFSVTWLPTTTPTPKQTTVAAPQHRQPTPPKATPQTQPPSESQTTAGVGRRTDGTMYGFGCLYDESSDNDSTNSGLIG